MTSYYLAEPTRMVHEQLHDAEMKCLKIIDTFQPVSLHKVAEYMHCGKSRITQLVHALESNDFIQRSTGIDHRMVLVSTTPKGSEAVQRVRVKYQLLAEIISSTLGQEDTEKLCDILHKISPLIQLQSSNKHEVRR